VGKGKRETKSPIKNLPVRLPGESIRRRIFDLLLDQFLVYYLIAFGCAIAALAFWGQYICGGLALPIMFTVLAVVAITLAFYKSIPAFREIENLKLGQMGEEAVGQFLEEKLRPMGCQVLHDIPMDGFNIDHVVVGPSGIYCIETKTHSKPVKGDHRVVYDGEKVTVDGFTPDRDPITQAKANTRALFQLLESTTGKRFSIRPIVLYPGWWVEKMPPNAEVWVLSHKAIPSFIGNGKQSIDDPDIHLVTYHLKRYVITKTKEQAACE